MTGDAARSEALLGVCGAAPLSDAEQDGADRESESSCRRNPAQKGTNRKDGWFDAIANDVVGSVEESQYLLRVEFCRC